VQAYFFFAPTQNLFCVCNIPTPGLSVAIGMWVNMFIHAGLFFEHFEKLKVCQKKNSRPILDKKLEVAEPTLDFGQKLKEN